MKAPESNIPKPFRLRRYWAGGRGRKGVEGKKDVLVLRAWVPFGRKPRSPRFQRARKNANERDKTDGKRAKKIKFPFKKLSQNRFSEID